MTRAFALLASLFLVMTPLAGCLEESDIDQFLDDILGCMDEKAENYDENATVEMLEDCIYLVSVDTFMDEIENSMEIDKMLEESPKAGYSLHITSSGYNEELGSDISMNIEKTVMADIGNSSAYIRELTEVTGMITIDYSVTQVGESINVKSSISGMFAGGGEPYNTLTRDNNPDIMQLIQSIEESDDSVPVDDLALDPEISEDANYSVSWDSAESKHVLSINWYEDETEQDVTMTISLSEDEQLISYLMVSKNVTSESSMQYTAMWGDAIIIEIDENLPRTALPISWDYDTESEDNWDDGDDSDDNSSEWSMNHFWGCGLVNVDSTTLDDWENETIIDAISAHPEFPDWCGEVVGVDDLPPEISDGEPGFDSPQMRWASLDEDGQVQFVTVSQDTFKLEYPFMSESDCEMYGLVWDETDSLCGDHVPIWMDMDDTIQVVQWPDGEMEYIRYEVNGDHMFIGFLNPTIEEPIPDPVDTVLLVNSSQIFNAPISEFEFRALDCSAAPDQVSDEGENLGPNVDDCVVIHSDTLTTLPVTWNFEDESWFSFSYSDNDDDGMISSGDELLLTNGTQLPIYFEVYDTWAEEYVSQSKAVAPDLPGFGAIIAIICLIGASLSSRRD